MPSPRKNPIHFTCISKLKKFISRVQMQYRRRLLIAYIFSPNETKYNKLQEQKLVQSSFDRIFYHCKFFSILMQAHKLGKLELGNIERIFSFSFTLEWGFCSTYFQVPVWNGVKKCSAWKLFAQNWVAQNSKVTKEHCTYIYVVLCICQELHQTAQHYQPTILLVRGKQKSWRKKG